MKSNSLSTCEILEFAQQNTPWEILTEETKAVPFLVNQDMVVFLELFSFTSSGGMHFIC